MSNEIKSNMAHVLLSFCCSQHKKERYKDFVMSAADTVADPLNQGFIFNSIINPDDPWCSYKPEQE